MSSKCKFVFPCLARCSCFFTWCMVTLDWHRFLWQIKYRSNKKLSGKREVDKLGGHVTLNTCSWKNKKCESMLSFTAKSYFQRSNSLKTTNKFSRWFYYDCYLLSKWCRYQTMYLKNVYWNKQFFSDLKKIIIFIKYQWNVNLR